MIGFAGNDGNSSTINDACKDGVCGGSNPCEEDGKASIPVICFPCQSLATYTACKQGTITSTNCTMLIVDLNYCVLVL